MGVEYCCLLPDSLERMHSMDDLLHLIHSDGADELQLHVGKPPVIVLDGEGQSVEGPTISAEDLKEYFRSVTNTRQRRELMEQGAVEFIYRFRGRVSFLVQAKIEGENVAMHIH